LEGLKIKDKYYLKEATTTFNADIDKITDKAKLEDKIKGDE
jgi:hypothetical protein